MAIDINGFLHSNNNGILWDIELSKRIEDEKCLERYGFKVYSQNDEDGIIEEIFSRIGTTNKKFIEFGVQNGLESNGHYLLLKGWSGLWLEYDEKFYNEILINFKNVIKNEKLLVANEFVTKDNIDSILLKYEQEREIDLLSIDIDGNDYHVWKAISNICPRVVVIEYNAKIPPTCDWIMPYCEQHTWDGGDKHGASLLALEKLGTDKGYTLVATNISGVNAFFIRNDCLNEKFTNRKVTELYNPPRYYKTFYAGHPSFYCLKDIEGGRKQLFYGKSGKVLFRSGTYSSEKPNSDICWMSNVKSVLWVLDENNKANVVRIHLRNATAHVKEAAVPQHLTNYVEDKIVIDYELKFPEEIVEIELFRDNLQNDEVIQISICIDCLWCPANINMGSDTRNLGLLIQNVEICDK